MQIAGTGWAMVNRELYNGNRGSAILARRSVSEGGGNISETLSLAIVKRET
jgi:hypothetical protein